MLGAIIGDLAGSIYEFEQIKQIKRVEMKNIIEENSFFSDDTILTVAVADALLSETDFEAKIKEYAKRYQSYSPNFKPYFKTPFSPNFMAWANGTTRGTSLGNGAMMRVSPIGFWFDNEKDVQKFSELATVCSHDNKEAVECAKTIALIIFFAKNGFSKTQIKEKLNLKIEKPKIEKFNFLCEETLKICLYSVFETNNFEDCVKMALSFGGDTDTNACISASMAEAFYGIDENLAKKAKSKLPPDLLSVVERFYDALKTRF